MAVLSLLIVQRSINYWLRYFLHDDVWLQSVCSHEVSEQLLALLMVWILIVM